MKESLALYLGVPVVALFIAIELHDWIRRPKRRGAVRVEGSVVKRIAARNSSVLYIRYPAGDSERVLRYRQPWLAKQFREADPVLLWVKPDDLPEEAEVPTGTSVHLDTNATGSDKAEIEDGDTSRIAFLALQLALLAGLLFVGLR